MAAQGCAAICHQTSERVAARGVFRDYRPLASGRRSRCEARQRAVLLLREASLPSLGLGPPWRTGAGGGEGVKTRRPPGVHFFFTPSLLNGLARSQWGTRAARYPGSVPVSCSAIE